MVIVILVILVVNVLLLFASGQFLRRQTNWIRILIGAVFESLLTVLSLIPGTAFLNPVAWRLCSLLLTGILVYGWSRKGLVATVLFSLLHFSLGGITGNQNTLLPPLLGAVGIGLACLVLGKQQNLIPVELTYGDRTLCITALRDTGNTLRDPITGKTVLIVSADVAETLTGLTRADLRNPVKTIQSVPGLRLIPYKTVGDTGFLLALTIPNVRIGNRQGGSLVALSPNLFGSNYQAITGGMV